MAIFLSLCFSKYEAISVVNDMITKHESKGLLNALQKLYFKLSEMELLEHVKRYRYKTGSNEVRDISTPLIKHVDKLVAESKQSAIKQNQSPAVHATEHKSVTVGKTKNINKTASQPSRLKKVFDGLGLPFKTSTSKKASDQYMGDKLKESIWLHIHTALMQARNGEVVTAKMHADIANQALKEAAHFMNAEDYNVLCSEVDKSLPTLKINK